MAQHQNVFLQQSYQKNSSKINSNQPTSYNILYQLYTLQPQEVPEVTESLKLQQNQQPLEDRKYQQLIMISSPLSSMLPIGGDFNPIFYTPCSFQYSQPYKLFNMYTPWRSQYNFLPPICNFTQQLPIFFEVPSQTKDTRKSSFQKMSQQEKQEDCKKIRKIQRQSIYHIKKEKDIENGCSQYCINQFDNEESSYNSKRRKFSQKIKKPKRGPQNQNRNILPSIVQQIFSFLCKQTKSKAICERIFLVIPRPEGVDVSVSRYYYYIKQIKQKQNHYVNEKTLEILSKTQEIGINLFCEQQQKFYLRVARILAKHFLVHISPFLTLYSKRIIQEKRIEHLNIRRVLLRMISRLDC